MDTIRHIEHWTWGFAKAEPVFCVALFAALASMLITPPSLGYAHYIDWRTLALLSMFMLCTAGLQEAGAIQSVAHGLLERAGSCRAVVAALVALPFFASMLVTNDVSLLAFVPLSLTMLASRKDLLPLTLTLQTIAANAGSFLTPFGNPQNLYVYSAFNVGFGEFLLAQLPFVLLNGLLLTALVCFAGRRGRGSSDIGDTAGRRGRGSSDILASGPRPERPADIEGTHSRTLFYAALFVLSVLAVLRVIPVAIAFALVVAAVVVAQKRLFLQIDWVLLLTFVMFFIFSGNLVHSGISAQGDFLVTVGASQIISNVPATILL
ncbi:MAG: hypothetical protein IJJ14_01340, partial [Coriobacteriales bacterium]|nr:hypothetical protein [Coriobacteriales bacterium]